MTPSPKADHGNDASAPTRPPWRWPFFPRCAVALLPLAALSLGWLACGATEGPAPVSDTGEVDAANPDATCPDCGVGLICAYEPAEGCTAKARCFPRTPQPCSGGIPDRLYCSCGDAASPATPGACDAYEKPLQPVQSLLSADECYRRDNDY